MRGAAARTGGPGVSCRVPAFRYWTRALATATAGNVRNVRNPQTAAVAEPPTAYPSTTAASVTAVMAFAFIVPACEAVRLRHRALQRFSSTESSFPREGRA